jgi:hypothetical protein
VACQRALLLPDHQRALACAWSPVSPSSSTEHSRLARQRRARGSRWPSRCPRRATGGFGRLRPPERGASAASNVRCWCFSEADSTPFERPRGALLSLLGATLSSAFHREPNLSRRSERDPLRTCAAASAAGAPPRRRGRLGSCSPFKCIAAVEQGQAGPAPSGRQINRYRASRVPDENRLRGLPFEPNARWCPYLG